MWTYVGVWILVVSEVYVTFYVCFILMSKLKEGACILTGISYDGIDKDGYPKWGALSNVHALNFELSYTLQVSPLNTTHLY